MHSVQDEVLSGSDHDIERNSEKSNTLGELMGFEMPSYRNQYQKSEQTTEANASGLKMTGRSGKSGRQSIEEKASVLDSQAQAKPDLQEQLREPI